MKRVILAALSVIFFADSAYALKSVVPTTFDPSMAYVLIEIRSIEVLAGASVPGTIILTRYDPERQDIRGGNRSLETALAKKDRLRVEFSNLVVKPLVKEKSRRLYFMPMVPDYWVIEGTRGTAFSLGSFMFRLEPGKIYDLGVFSPQVDARPGQKATMSVGDLMAKSMMFGMFSKKREADPDMIKWHARGDGDMPVPAALEGKELQPITYVPGARFGNYLGGMINRIGGRAERVSSSVSTNGTVQQEEASSGLVLDNSAQ